MVLTADSRPNEERHRQLVDSLPYVDGAGNDPHYRGMAEQMVEEEMARGGGLSQEKIDAYLGPMPELSFQGHDMLENEMLRVSHGLPIDPLDMSRYESKAPTGKAEKDVKAWDNALKNAESQFEHQKLKMLNSLLYQEYGAEAWKRYIALLEALFKAQEKALAKVDEEVKEISKERLKAQLAVAKEEQTLKTEFFDLVRKNFDLDVAVRQLEAEVGRRGLALPKLGGDADE
mmetsp:Transcript_16273/g.41237  ORF Transcript_16273/g.41237 Transcript_16273/m.41237 type:complete len:231 (-) Transcript_16273:305-997(-)|eukprot:CAMPEP_0113900822 /NCGR_PEP_ID=MMETSP0780_2-20120614/20899_1 /TAXON_ID=652834 /ORGANISM="Palpitomonas bilix" /LENGTH=230 /DNA_ID=CAMNT_0000893341 /DNA_START=266 /DNA_END=958 /DNA_ORIENTATION=- /assembly_acc=CAM_ASM_000599